MDMQTLAAAVALSKGSGGGGGGGGGAGLIVHGVDMTTGKGTLDKTWQEIYNAMSAGNSVVLIDEQEIGGENYYMALTLINISRSPYNYAVQFGEYNLYCDTPDDYPSHV